MNQLFVELELASWKPWLSLAMLPPIPCLVLVLIGGWWIPRRRLAGWSVLWVGVALVYLSCCPGSAAFLSQTLLHPPPPLGEAAIAELKAAVSAEPAGRPPSIAIIVLGGGMERQPAEYLDTNLTSVSMERLRYGEWLARRTGAPLGFSGGVGYAQADPDIDAEASIAARIARQEYGRPLTWVENRSRDTRENASMSLALLRAAGVKRIVLVTHGFHMPRALRAFRQAAGDGITVEPATLGMARLMRHEEGSVTDWIPTERGFMDTRFVIHEILGVWFGA